MTVDEVMREVRDRLTDGRISAAQFDMGRVMDTDHTCGSIGCIGGWGLALLSDNGRVIDDNWHSALTTELLDKTQRRKTLYDLFFHWPDHEGDVDGISLREQERHFSIVTPAEAVQAIDAWLNGCTNNPWSHVK
jgi:hypothetical protein